MLIVFALLFAAGAAADEGGTEEDSSPAKIPTVPTTEATTVPTTVITTVPTTEATTVQTTEITTVPTTEATTVQTTEIPTVPTTEETTVQTTEIPTMPTTEATTVIPTQQPTETTQESESGEQKSPEQKPYADTEKSSLPEDVEGIQGLLKKQKTVLEEALEEADAKVAASTRQEEEPQPVSVPSPQYLSGGTAESYPLNGDARLVYPGNTAFVYEKIKIQITASAYATSIAYMSGSANPSALNTIQADANGVINLLDVSVGGYTGAYRIYNGSEWTGGYLYIWQPDLILRAEYAGSTDSVDGKAVSKSSSIHYIIDSPKVGPSGIGAKAQIIVTTPVGGQTTMLGSVSLADIDINSVRVTTRDISLADSALRGGTYTSRAEWITPQVFANYAKKSNTVTYYLGSSTGISLTAGSETVVRSNPFTVTVSGLPNTPYLISLDAGRSPGPQLIAGQPGVVRGSENPKVSIGGGEKSVLLPDGASGDPNSWGVVTTDASGKRVVQYSTSPVNGRPVEEGSYTVRINDITDYGTAAGKGSDYDRVSIRITVGGMSMTATDSKNSYYLGEEIRLSGTNTDSDTTYLFLTGPNLNSNGVSLATLASGELTKVSVKSDHTWEYRWDTSSTGLDTGSYTIYAVSTMNDKSHLSGTQYATYSVQLKQPGLSTATSSFAAAKGDTVHITGTVTGSPSSVAIFLFGSNYYERRTVSVSDGGYDYRMAIPESMSAGEYFVVVEHPMNDGRFGVQEIHQDGKTVLAMAAPGGGTQSSFVVEGPGRLQGSQAANALVKMLASPYIDDLYTTLTLTVQSPYIEITPVGTRYAGEPFAVSGRTNLAPQDKLLVEVVPASFVPSGKNNPVSSYGTAGSVAVMKGSPDNSWSFSVDGSKLSPDTYTVKVSGESVSTSSSATFDVVPKPMETPTPRPTETIPGTTVPTTVPPAPTESPSVVFWWAGLIVCGAAVLGTLRR
ncbi:hypothetical protein [Methanocorpusculum vombati]|uniref:Bacterial Ig-like domain-containing protein n=1 Tax=Methanocorpusculum vombati TaxID=3002864 RepID=A0ABT4IK12_9EURY|nr:hypothetical protein [Methanocorpusculum vombati]MCZ0862078.1 hypothetical protein [Methanocorpusculum vombati]